jgi:hypothetical protein
MANTCKCFPPNNVMVVKVSQKEGVNKGRSFFSCPNFVNSDSKGCGAFKWADGGSPTSSSSSSSSLEEVLKELADIKNMLRELRKDIGIDRPF